MIERRSLIASQPNTIQEMQLLLDILRREGAPGDASLEIENGQVYCSWKEIEARREAER